MWDRHSRPQSGCGSHTCRSVRAGRATPSPARASMHRHASVSEACMLQISAPSLANATVHHCHECLPLLRAQFPIAERGYGKDTRQRRDPPGVRTKNDNVSRKHGQHGVHLFQELELEFHVQDQCHARGARGCASLFASIPPVVIKWVSDCPWDDERAGPVCLASTPFIDSNILARLYYPYVR